MPSGLRVKQAHRTCTRNKEGRGERGKRKRLNALKVFYLIAETGSRPLRVKTHLGSFSFWTSGAMKPGRWLPKHGWGGKGGKGEGEGGRP